MRHCGRSVELENGRKRRILVRDATAHGAGVERLVALDGWWRRRPRNIAEVLLGEFAGLGRLEVADHHERRVVGNVVLLEECLHVLDFGRVEIRHRADQRVSIRETLQRIVRHAQGVDKRSHVRLIVEAQAALLLHRLLLVVQVRLRDGERAHAVRLEPEAEVEAIRREQVPVVRAVRLRGTVELAARALHVLKVLGFLHVGRALKHHVLEQVRETGAPRSLVSRAHIVPDIHCNDLGGVIFHELDRESIRQRETLDLYLPRILGLGHCDGSDE